MGKASTKAVPAEFKIARTYFASSNSLKEVFCGEKLPQSSSNEVIENDRSDRVSLVQLSSLCSRGRMDMTYATHVASLNPVSL